MILDLPDADPLDVRLRFVELLNECIERISILQLPEARIEENIKTIKKVQKLFVAFGNVERVGHFTSNANPAMFSLVLSSIGDSIETSGRSPLPSFSLSDFISETEDLLEKLDLVECDKYLKEALRIEVRAVLRSVSVGRLYSAEMIRKRVKAVYADFCAEFNEHDKNYETLKEMLLRWMKNGLGPGAFVLGLTADATSVVALLPSPTEP
jgi:hypothetical protein